MSGHPATQELMLWQSGELTEDAARVVDLHLAVCEACMQKVERMESIYALASEVDESQLPKKRVRAVIAGTSAVLIVAVAAMSVMQLTPEARADALLDKAARMEPARALRIHRGAESCVVRPAEATVAVGGFCAGVAENLHQAGWGWSDLLSARSFKQWRVSLHHKRDAVQKTATHVEVSTATEDGQIRRASLELRASDDRAVAARIEFADTSVIDVEESVDADVPLVVSHPVPERVPTKKAPTGTIALDPMDDAEARVRLALHGMNQDANILLAVDRGANGIHVWGVAPTDAAKASIAASLAGIPSVDLAIESEAAQEQSHAPLPWQAFQGNALPLASAQMQGLFAGDARGHERFLDSVDEETRRLLGEAKTRDALLRLAARVPDPRAVELKRAAEEITVSMAADVVALVARMQPIAPLVVRRQVLSLNEAQQLYTLAHEVVFLSRRDDGLTLDDAVARMQAVLGGS